MKFGSVCSGIEAASVAFNPLGWDAAWFAEIEAFPSAVLAHHYPDVQNVGDMTKIVEMLHTFQLDAPDMLCGGTPCQAFSVAGLRNSLDDARGNLSLTFCEIANAIDTTRLLWGEQPAIIFWENVPGVLNTKDNAFGCFLAGLAGEDDALIPPGGKWTDAGYVHGPQRTVAWRTLDAQYFGLAQRRKRVFVVASAREGFDPAKVLFEFDGLRRDTAPRREARETTSDATITSPDTGCSVTGCERESEKRGLCNTHYQRWRKDGDAFDQSVVNAPGKTDSERFWPKVEKTDRCWNWLGAINESGYGIFSVDGTDTVRAHRFAYEQSKGNIPIGFQIDHLCRNRKCVNPNHLEAVTPLENTRRGDAGKHWADKRAAPTLVSNGDAHSGYRDEKGLVPHIAQCLTTRTGQRYDPETETILPAVAFHPTQDPISSTDGTTHAMGCGSSGGQSSVAVAYTTKLHNTASNQSGKFYEEYSTSLDRSSPPPAVVAFTAGVDYENNGFEADKPCGPLMKDSPTGGGRPLPAISLPTMQVRRLTPVECARLQGFPDTYLDITYRNKPAADGPKYKALGNSWAVPVVRWIGQRIKEQL